MIRIRGEVPQFKRCCICLPLRHGLIVWGYIRLVIGVLILINVTNIFFRMLTKSKNEAGYEVHLVLFGFFVILGGADIVLNVVFVYAAHTKNLKMLKAYYIYSFILWILMIIMGVYLFVYAVHVMKLLQMDIIRVFDIIFDVVTFLAQVVIQAYILLLVRSEFRKLTTDCEFRFVNNAAESACEMKCKEDNIANGNIIAKRDIISNTDNTADRDITANRNLANGVKGVYKNGTSKSYIMTY